jgi:RNA 2',3'-cyclic 3'-phosphodiesterase
MIRAFLAIDLPESYQAKLTAVQDYLKQSRADVRWTSVSSIHLTLKFFGDITENQVEELTAAATPIAAATPAFTLGVQGVGTFPGPKNPRVIWLGLSDQLDILAKLVQNLEQAFAPLGFPPEKRPFTAHLTLGRVRSSQGREALRQSLQTVALPDFVEFQVKRLVLYRSTLRPQGALYTPLHQIVLGGM